MSNPNDFTQDDLIKLREWLESPFLLDEWADGVPLKRLIELNRLDDILLAEILLDEEEILDILEN